MRKIIAFVALVFLSTACSSAEQVVPEEQATPGEGSAVDSEARIGRIETALRPTFTIRGEQPRSISLAERMDELNVPGVSVAVFEDGAIVWARGWGLADVAGGRPVNSDTLFQAASISKPVAALAALRMVEQGALDLDGNVNDYLTSWQMPDNEFTADEKVTLRRLLNHSAGTTVWGFPGYGPDEEVPTTTGVLDGTGNTDPIRVFKEPGESWRYTGGGYTVMQLMVADVAGRPFTEVMRESVLEPAGMSHSTYEQPLPADRRDEAATGYRPDGSIVDGNYHTYPEQAAAGLWTTPSDLARYAMAIQRANRGESGALLSPETTREMLTPGMEDHGLGPGIEDGGARFGHGGSNEGFRCQLTAFTDGSGGIAVMTNSDNGSPLAQEIILTVAAEYSWPGLEPDERIVATLAPEAYQRLTGTYDIPDVIQVEVHYRDGSLWLIAPESDDMEILPESETRFFVREDGRPVTFEIDGDEIELVAFGVRGKRIGGSR